MRVISKKRSFTNDKKELVEYTQYFIEDAPSGALIPIKAVYKGDKALLRMLARRDSDEAQESDD